MLVLPPKIRWSLILLVLLTMISSALISARMVDQNDRAIASFQKDVDRHNELIRALWQDTSLQENRLHMLVLYTTLAQNREDKTLQGIAEKYALYVRPGMKKPLSMQALPGFLDEVSAKKKQIIERIDDLFIAKLDWEEEISERSRRGALYTSLALFIQLLSVAMITIVRDLR